MLLTDVAISQDWQFPNKPYMARGLCFHAAEVDDRSCPYNCYELIPEFME